MLPNLKILVFFWRQFCYIASKKAFVDLAPTHFLDEFFDNAQFYAKSSNCGKNDGKL